MCVGVTAQTSSSVPHYSDWCPVLAHPFGNTLLIICSGNAKECLSKCTGTELMCILIERINPDSVSIGGCSALRCVKNPEMHIH